jgi:hypothetical protein
VLNWRNIFTGFLLTCLVLINARMQLTGALQTVGTHCIKEALLASLAFL